MGGEIDGLTADQMEAALLTAEAGVAAPDGHLRLDLRDVPFMDSSGLRVLLDVTDRMRRRGGDLVLVAPTAPVIRLLELSQLDDHFTIES